MSTTINNSEYFKKRIFSFELECSIDGRTRVLERLEKCLGNFAFEKLQAIEVK